MTIPDIEKTLRRKFEAELEARIRRTKEIGRQCQRFIGAHYFAEASYQCLELYRDGYMLGCIMCSQALLQAVLKFVLQRNRINNKRKVEDLIKLLKDKSILNGKALDAATLAWQHRNDFHHLNPGVSAIDLELKAKECIGAICTLEEELFGGTFAEGKFIPRNPTYWDISAEGTVPVFLRQLDV